MPLQCNNLSDSTKQNMQQSCARLYDKYFSQVKMVCFFKRDSHRWTAQ